jgi:hypothetical protein
MTQYDTLQQSFAQNPFGPQQWGSGTFGQQGGPGLGQAAFGGQQYGQFGGQPTFGASTPGAFGIGSAGQPMGWGQQQWGGQQRQLSQQDVNEVVRQLIPALPQILAQAQSPFGGMGYAAYGQAPFGQGQRQLSPQDVNEVVRQLLPIVPQIVGMLQGQPQMQHAAMHGGFGQGQQFGGLGQSGLGHPGQTHPAQMWGAQFGAPQFQAAFGGSAPFGQQRQLTQQDIADITRQLIGVLPQVIGNLQAYSQQRII